MIERFRAYGVLRPSVERSLRVAASVDEAMGLIDSSPAPSQVPSPESRSV
jgi:hypothetical protein